MKDTVIVFVYTENSPASVEVANLINNSNYSNVISVVSADNAKARDHLRFGKYQLSSVPAFLVIETVNGVDNAVPYYGCSSSHVLALASVLLSQLPDGDCSLGSISSTSTIGGFRAANSSESRETISRVSSRYGDLPSILADA